MISRSDHYVEVVNKRAAVYDRSGRLQVGPFTMNQLFTDAAKEWEDDICATTNEGDPVVAYNERAGVFVMSQFAFRTVEEPNADGEQANARGRARDVVHRGV